MAGTVAVIGAGWAGLAAAVEATRLGHTVELYEMAAQPGGRARSVRHQGQTLDNGQHILIGAYRETLALMRQVGADPERLLRRLPLCLAYPDGSGLCLRPGAPVPALVRAVLGWRTLPWRERLGLLWLAGRWRLNGFVCAPALTVAELCRDAPRQVYSDLIEPLCVAALNTPARQASAQTFLTVLRDALLSGPGSADLLLPAAPLGELLPAPALAWLAGHGARIRLGQRVQNLAADPDGSWRVDGQVYGRVILATPAAEAGRLLASLAPGWSAQASALPYEPIITVWVRAPGTTWPRPMMALRAGPGAPAQFGFASAALGGPDATYTLVVSGAADWVALGLDATAEAVRTQLAAAFAAWPGWHRQQLEVLAVRAEKRATFACKPELLRPRADPLRGLQVAGDYVDGPYPATLEGSVRAGLAAARAL